MSSLEAVIYKRRDNKRNNLTAELKKQKNPTISQTYPYAPRTLIICQCHCLQMTSNFSCPLPSDSSDDDSFSGLSMDSAVRSPLSIPSNSSRTLSAFPVSFQLLLWLTLQPFLSHASPLSLSMIFRCRIRLVSAFAGNAIWV